ncbi:unnamed protein product [Rhizophagus irregularis]|uniref:Uncharacterized protein n=2 Tax=Rhizophagus irregularis TaxID=588596 RepID=A0A916DZK7_9GLOM|nr:unnamed protein product [Rhizophagus irregularis]GBC24669.2 hypothetical protein RIR_jg1045.t1 [Rhizophagus irregularis DAOM 181602=DAOM 197198]CAB4475266.1 unnamed protein product [Rhizophagus irregularis]CAB5149703.1 unnamed protein product [Rhizophagus irregularis]CAB5330641.1 unnamed protein product [Rhizophagus irregularis]
MFANIKCLPSSLVMAINIIMSQHQSALTRQLRERLEGVKREEKLAVESAKKLASQAAYEAASRARENQEFKQLTPKYKPSKPRDIKYR